MAINKNTILLPFNVKDDTPYSVPGGGGQGIPPTEEESDELLRRGWSSPEEIDPTTGWSKDIVDELQASTYVIDGDVWRYTDEGKVINPGGGIQGENRPYEPVFDGEWEESPSIEPVEDDKDVDESSFQYRQDMGQTEHDYMTTDQLFKFITGVLPNPENPWETSEFLLDLWMDAKYFGKGAAAGALVPDGPLMIAGELVGGLMAVAARRGMTTGAKRLWRHAMERLDGLKDLGTGGMAGKVGTGFGGDVPLRARMYFARSGLRDGVFDLDTWRKAGGDRNVMELFQTRWDQVAYRNMPHKQFTSTRKRLIKPFLEEYGDYLKRFNIDPSTIELHHIFGLNLSAPLYDGLRYGSKEWEEMTTLLNKAGLFPGAPGTSVAKKSNLMLALAEPHDLLHQQFFKNTIGVKGEKFFTKERIKLIRSGPAGRNQVAKEYAKHVKKGEVLIKRAMDQIQATFGASNITPERLANAFSQSLADGTTNIFKEGYKIESVNKVVKDMVFDIQLDELVNPLRGRPFRNITELKKEIMIDRANGMSHKQLTKKYPGLSVKQLDLFDQ